MPAPKMTSFFRDRGLGLAAVVLIMLAISLGQAGISYSVTFGALQHILPRYESGMVTAAILIMTFRREA